MSAVNASKQRNGFFCFFVLPFSCSLFFFFFLFFVDAIAHILATADPIPWLGLDDEGKPKTSYSSILELFTTFYQYDEPTKRSRSPHKRGGLMAYFEVHHKRWDKNLKQHFRNTKNIAVALHKFFVVGQEVGRKQCRRWQTVYNKEYPNSKSGYVVSNLNKLLSAGKLPMDLPTEVGVDDA